MASWSDLFGDPVMTALKNRQNQPQDTIMAAAQSVIPQAVPATPAVPADVQNAPPSQLINAEDSENDPLKRLTSTQRGLGLIR